MWLPSAVCCLPSFRFPPPPSAFRISFCPPSPVRRPPSSRMRYRSTRDSGPALTGFGDLLLGGPAPDGGLYVPESWPQVDAAGTRGTFVSRSRGGDGGAFRRSLLHCRRGRRRWRSRTTRGSAIPRWRLSSDWAHDDWLLDLTWGPTLSFKDYAMALLGAMMEAAVERTGERVLVLGATSGDTGSAAIEALRGRTGIDVVILYPEGRVSEIQRRQMTTVEESNVHAVAIDGTFDDCQDLAKALLADPDLAPKHRLAGFNSINWARVAPQTAFAAWAAARSGNTTGGTGVLGTDRKLRQHLCGVRRSRRWGSRWADWLSGPTATTG